MFPQDTRPKGVIKRSRNLREWRGDVKEDFFNRLISPIFIGRIEYVAWVMDGGKGSGKSTMNCSIYEVILNEVSTSEIIFTPNHPESAEVNLIAVRSLKQVFSLLDKRPYQVLLIDDASRYNEKLLKKVLQDFNEIRHHYEKLTGEGEIILLLMVQDVFQLAKILRKDISGFIFKDCPQDESDQNYINRQTCYKGRTLLATWTSKVKDDKILSFLSRALISTESWAGYMSIPQSKDSRFRPYSEIANPTGIKFLKPETEESISLNFQDGTYTFKEKTRVDILDSLIFALQNYDSFVRETKLSTNKLQNKNVLAYIQYLQGWTYDNVAEYHNISAASLSNDYENGGWYAIVREELIGHIVEWILVQEGSYYADYSIIAGNKRVDLLSPDKQKAIEVKCRHRYEKPSNNMICTEMHEILSKGSKGCELALCVVKKTKGECIIYSIILSTQNTQNPQNLKGDKSAQFKGKNSNFTTPPPLSSFSSSGGLGLGGFSSPDDFSAVLGVVKPYAKNQTQNRCNNCNQFVSATTLKCKRCGDKTVLENNNKGSEVDEY